MSDEEKLKLRTDAEFDRGWAALADKLGTLQRIALSYPNDTDDEKFVRGVLIFVAGEVYRRSAQRYDPPTDPT